MKQILHILSKDLRRYAWAWGTLLFCAGIEVYLQGTTAGLLDSSLNRGLSMLTSMIGGILFFIVIVMVVQEESLADPDAYWLSRPISRGKLLASKLLFVLILIGIGQISELIVLTMNGGAARAPYALLSILTALAIWQSQIFLAAQTRSLPRYLLLVVCLFIGFYALIFGMMFFADALFEWDFDFDWGQLPADTPEHWLSLIQTLYWFLVGLGILSLIYLRRRILIAWLLLIPALLFAAILTPRESFLGIDAGMELGAFGEETHSLELDHLRKGGTMHTNGEELIEVRAAFKVYGETEAEDLWATVRSPALRMDGQTIELNNNNQMASQRLKEELDGNYSIRLGYALRNQLTGDELNLAVDFSLDITFSTQVEVGTLAIEEGATYVGDGNRLVIRSIYREDNNLKVTLAATLPSYSFEPDAAAPLSEAFEGKFSFALMTWEGKHLQDFRLSRSWNNMETATGGKIEAFLEDAATLEDFRIIVFAREITGNTFDYMKSSDISFQK